MFDREIARQLEQDILGPRKHLLPCGCVLAVVARMPGTTRLMTFDTPVAHEFCGGEHSKVMKLHTWRAMFVNTFQGWYAPELRPVTMEQFQAAFDAQFSFRDIEYSKQHLHIHPSDRRLVSTDGRTYIYRTGVIKDLPVR